MSFTPSRFLRMPTTQWSLRWYEEFFSTNKWMEGTLEQPDRRWNHHHVRADCRHDGRAGIQPLPVQVARGASTPSPLTPVFTPAVIIAMALLNLAYKSGLWGGYTIIAISHSLWAFPLVIMVLKVSLDGLDRSLEEAARGMGASPLQTFYTRDPAVDRTVGAGRGAVCVHHLHQRVHHGAVSRHGRHRDPARASSIRRCDIA